MKMLLAGVCVALIVVAAASAAPPPEQLLGTWTRTVSAQDIRREHASKKVKAGSTWTLVITQRKSTASSPGARPYSGSIIPSSATQVNIEIGVHEANLYNWRRAGKTLTLMKYTDPSADRAAILVGAWKRSSVK